MILDSPNNASIEQRPQARIQGEGHTGVSYTEAPFFHTRIHRETVHVATVYRYTVLAQDTGVLYMVRAPKCPESGRIGAANCTKLRSKKDQQQMTFFGGRECTR